MIREGKRMSRLQRVALAAPSIRPARWEGIPLFARPILEGCWDEEAPPRLEADDLQNPEHFHERLAAWLMKQH